MSYLQVMFVLQSPHKLGPEGLALFFMGEQGVRISLDPSDTQHSLELESVCVPQKHAQLDLTVMLGEARDTLSCSFQYNTGS